MGNEGGNNDYVGLLNMPVSAFDPHGLEPKKKDDIKHCCCCCADDVVTSVKEKKKLFWGGIRRPGEKAVGFPTMIGHRITMDIALSYPHTEPEISKVTDCKFKWEEASTMDIYGPASPLYVKGDKNWYDITVGVIQTGNASAWTKRTRPCNDKETCPFVDDPGINPSSVDPVFTAAFSWDHWIRITVTSGAKQCPCKYDSVTVGFRRSTSWGGPIVITGSDRNADEQMFADKVKLTISQTITRVAR